MLNLLQAGNGGYPTGVVLFLDYPTASNVTKAYQNLAITGTGTSGTTIITASGTAANIVQAGEKIRIGGTDIYTVASVSTVTINTVETLSANYPAQALALDRISQWNDQSGKGNHATQGTAAKQPVYNPSQFNSLNVTSWDGANTLILPSGLYQLSGGLNTIFAVCKRNSETAVSNRIVAMNTTNATNVRYYLNLSATSGQVQFLNNTATAVNNNGNTNTNYQILTGSHTSTTGQSLQVNNGTAATDSNGVNTAAATGAYIGSNFDTDRYLIGGIAKLIIYNRALSAGEIIQVNKILSRETGITIS